MASTYDFTFTRGSEFEIRLQLKNENGSVINLSGYNTRGSLKHRYSDAGTLLDLSPTIISGSNGSLYSSGYIDIKMLASQTSGLPIVQGVYDVEIYSGTYAQKPVKGFINILPEVTN